MRDELDGRLWADHHNAFSSEVAALLATIMTAFKVLNRIEYSAPWLARAKKTCLGSRATLL